MGQPTRHEVIEHIVTDTTRIIAAVAAQSWLAVAHEIAARAPWMKSLEAFGFDGLTTLERTQLQQVQAHNQQIYPMIAERCRSVAHHLMNKNNQERLARTYRKNTV